MTNKIRHMTFTGSLIGHSNRKINSNLYVDMGPGANPLKIY